MPRSRGRLPDPVRARLRGADTCRSGDAPSSRAAPGLALERITGALAGAGWHPRGVPRCRPRVAPRRRLRRDSGFQEELSSRARSTRTSRGMSENHTTGASVGRTFSALDRWLEHVGAGTRSGSGGMAVVLVLAVAVLPRLPASAAAQLMESRAARNRDQRARRPHRWTAPKEEELYVGVTLLEALALAALWAVGIDDVTTGNEALAYAFSTMSTGGFSAATRLAARPVRGLAVVRGELRAKCGARCVRRRARALGHDEELQPLPRDPPRRVGNPRRDGLRLRPRARRGGSAKRRVPGGLDGHDDGALERGLGGSGRRSFCSRSAR